MDSKRGDAELMAQFCSTRDASLREEIILRYIPLVHYVLGRLGISQALGPDYEDAASQGLLGLIDAVDHYNPAFGTQFSTYATLRIRGKAIDHLRSHDWLSRGARKRARLIQEGISTLLEKLERTPSDDELAQFLNLNLSEVQQGLIDSSRMLVSLDSVVQAYESDEESSLHELIPDDAQPEPSEVMEENELKEFLTKLLTDMPRRDQLILSLYYHDELTFKEIGLVLNISESRVCQLHSRIMVSLQTMVRQHIQENEIARL